MGTGSIIGNGVHMGPPVGVESTMALCSTMGGYVNLVSSNRTIDKVIRNLRTSGLFLTYGFKSGKK